MIMKRFFWLCCLFLGFVTLAHTRASQPTTATTFFHNNTITNTEKVRKPTRLERWLIKKMATKRLPFQQLLNAKLDPPDDDEPAEPFKSSNNTQRNVSKAAKTGFWMLLLAPIIFFSTITQFDVLDNENTFSISLLCFFLFVTGIAQTIRSFHKEGFNFYNVASLFLIVISLLLVLAILVG
jgi:hypothetical protein